MNTAPGFFGIANWGFEGKIGSATNFTGDAGGSSGTFDLTGTDLDLSTENVMLVFKSGNQNSGTSLVAYLLTELAGAWDTMFTEPPFDFSGNATEKTVSHISVYASATVVPLPAGGLLLLTALGGLVLVRRRAINLAALVP